MIGISTVVSDAFAPIVKPVFQRPVGFKRIHEGLLQNERVPLAKRICDAEFAVLRPHRNRAIEHVLFRRLMYRDGPYVGQSHPLSIGTGVALLLFYRLDHVVCGYSWEAPLALAHGPDASARWIDSVDLRFRVVVHERQESARDLFLKDDGGLVATKGSITMRPPDDLIVVIDVPIVHEPQDDALDEILWYAGLRGKPGLGQGPFGFEESQDDFLERV